MKRIIFTLLVIAVAFFSSCKKEDTTQAQLEANKTVALRVSKEVVLQNNLNVNDIIASDFIYHQGASGTVLTRQNCLDFWQSIMKAFPDIKLTFQDVIAQGDLVAIRYTSHATHTGGAFFGIPAANTVINGSGLIIRRIKDGKVAEEWDYADVGSLVQQLTSKTTINITDAPSLGTSTTSIDQNTALAQRVSKEVVLQNNLNVDQIIGSTYTYHLGGTGTIMDKTAVLPFWQGIIAAFPNISLSFQQVFGEGNIVALRYTNTGTGAAGKTFLGLPVGGKTINSGGIIMRRIDNGRVVEEWDFTDIGTMMNQLQ